MFLFLFSHFLSTLKGVEETSFPKITYTYTHTHTPHFPSKASLTSIHGSFSTWRQIILLQIVNNGYSQAKLVILKYSQLIS